MRVLLDTNVLGAAFATRGLRADVLRTVLAEHAFLVPDTVISERFCCRASVGDRQMLID